MDTKELASEKAKLEKEMNEFISEKISQFNEKTGLQISDINASFTSSFGMGQKSIEYIFCGVHCDVKI